MRISDTGKKSGFPVSVPVYTGKKSGIRCRYPVSVSYRHRHRKPDFFPVPMYEHSVHIYYWKRSCCISSLNYKHPFLVVYKNLFLRFLFEAWLFFFSFTQGDLPSWVNALTHFEGWIFLWETHSAFDKGDSTFEGWVGVRKIHFRQKIEVFLIDHILQNFYLYLYILK